MNTIPALKIRYTQSESMMKIIGIFTLLGGFVQASTGSLYSSCHLSPKGMQRRCTGHDTYVRREWSCFDDAERLDYIKSVKCLLESPSRLPIGVALGAKSRYDDFVATHINATFDIHFNGVFLAWHRYFLHLFEKAMREECGYCGYLPYVNWPQYAKDLRDTPLFDGSPTSLGGDGYYDPIDPNKPNGNYTPPAGRGGGCVTIGPFANTTVSFRNIPLDGTFSSVPGDALEYQPHCMRRNLNSVMLRNSNNYTEIIRMLGEPNITAFQYRMDSFSFPGGQDSPNYGIHGGFHLAVGGQMADVFGSPADPVFWLHHGMIDNLWTQWQAMDPPNRQYALNGTNIMQNPPGSREITVDFEQDFGYLGSSQRTGDLMDVSKGPFCYGYAPCCVEGPEH